SRELLRGLLPEDHSVPLRLLLLLAAAIGPRFGGRHAEGKDGISLRGESKLRVGAEAAEQRYLVDAAHPASSASPAAPLPISASLSSSSESPAARRRLTSSVRLSVRLMASTSMAAWSAISSIDAETSTTGPPSSAAIASWNSTESGRYFARRRTTVL